MAAENLYNYLDRAYLFGYFLLKILFGSFILLLDKAAEAEYYRHMNEYNRHYALD